MKIALVVFIIIFIYLLFNYEGYAEFKEPVRIQTSSIGIIAQPNVESQRMQAQNSIEIPSPKESHNLTCIGSDCDRGNNFLTTDFRKTNFEAVSEPSYLRASGRPMDASVYREAVINKQTDVIKNLRAQMRKLAEQIDDQQSLYYRKKLSNKNYQPKPFLSHIEHEVLNLSDDDFSTKTLSTTKFLSETRASKYFGDDIHFPTELCGNFCKTQDPNAKFHEQLDIVRPITPTNFIPKVK